jgi:hypothetical protein
MTVHSFYVFNRRGTCLFHRDWSRSRRAAPSPGEDQKLVFGILLSSGGIASMLTPDKYVFPPPPVSNISRTCTACGECVRRERERGVKRFATKSYALHHLETPTGLRFVLTTDPSVSDASAVLWHVFANLWREHVTLNTLQPVGEPLSTPGFGDALHDYMRTLPYFPDRTAKPPPSPAAAASPPTATASAAAASGGGGGGGGAAVSGKV